MGSWTFEPGHSAAEFCARHMMVTFVRGHFKNIRGTLEFDPVSPELGHVQVEIDAAGLWTGEPARDDHLRSADFLDVEHHPTIRFRSTRVERIGDYEYRVFGDLTVHGVTREVPLDVRCLGQWETPWWEGDRELGPRTRAGFIAHTRINRHDFNVSWNKALDRGGVVVGNDVEITIDVEAIRDPD